MLQFGLEPAMTNVRSLNFLISYPFNACENLTTPTEVLARSRL